MAMSQLGATLAVLQRDRALWLRMTGELDKH
jgi:hypothetical protein